MNSSVNCVDVAHSPGNNVWINAFWNGIQMVYGQRRDGKKFVSICIALGARMLIPMAGLIGIFWATFENGPLEAPQIVVTFYWIVLLYLLIRMLISRELAGTPTPVNFPLMFLLGHSPRAARSRAAFSGEWPSPYFSASLYSG